MGKYVIIVIILLFLSAAPLLADYSGGTGEPNNPWQIACPNDLLYLGSHPADYNSSFILTADINLAAYTFATAVIAPDIDNVTHYYQGTVFTGTFDGNGCVIRNLNINTNGAGNEYLGLFGHTDFGCKITNLGIKDIHIIGGKWSYYLGGMVGHNSYSAISNCYATGEVKGGNNLLTLGGLVGYNYYSKISNCYAKCTVTGGLQSWDLGGLVGSNDYGNVINCYATGAVIGGNDSGRLGGLLGSNHNGIIVYSYWDIDSSGLMESDGGEGKKTSQMKDIDTFSNWSVEPAVWKINKENDYPHLAWEQLQGVPINSPLLSDFLNGLGTWDTPFLVSDVNELESVGEYPNQIQKGIHFKLISDINISSRSYTKAVIPVFSGIFDGMDFNIINLTIYASGRQNNYLGLFGVIEESGEVANLRIKDATIKGSDDSFYLGGLAGWNCGTINNCYATSTVSGRYGSLGLGGLVGSNYYGTVLSCNATSVVTGGEGSMSLGGLVGENYYGILRNCCSNGMVFGGNRSWASGGLLGENFGTFDSCCSTGTVFGGDNSRHLGGLVGRNSGTACNSYASGLVSGGKSSQYLGGLVGFNLVIVRNCYATGAVTSGDSSTCLGGLAGQNHGMIGDCFWDIQSSGRLNGYGYNSGTIANLLGKNTEEMQRRTTFTDYGWDFIGENANGTEDIWRMPFKTGYPVLNWQVLNFVDFAAFANAWQSTPADANWNPLCDLHPDNVIDTLDLQIFMEHWLTGL